MDLSSCVCGNVWLLRTSKDVSKVAIFVAGLFVYVFFFFHSVSQLPNRFRNCCVGCENGKFGFFIFFFYQKNVERY